MPHVRGAGTAAIAVALAAIALAASSVATATATTAGDLLSARAYASALYGPRGAQLPFAGPQQAVCATPGSGAVQCLIHVLAAGGAAPGARPGTVTTPTGLGPSTIKSVYGYTTSPGAGAGETMAIVAA
jgi:hypothetical protein